jgi:hypothetical protein
MRNEFFALALCAASMGIPLGAQTDRIPAGSEIAIRTNDTIDARSPSDGRIYTGVVDRDILNDQGVVAIPRGATAELILRDTGRDEVMIDLESISYGGRRYAVDTQAEPVTSQDERKEGVGANRRTGKYVGGGAALGAIIGAIAGGGKGAAIGAAAGAGAGAAGQTVTRGSKFVIPAETLITYRLDRSLIVGPRDEGYDQDGRHYHRYRQ